MNNYQWYIHSPQWLAKSSNIKRWFKNRCVLFPFLKADHSHHMTYKRLTHEWIIRDCVPLSKFAHSVIHFSLFWETPLRSLINLYLRVIALCLLVVLNVLPFKNN